MATFKSEDGTIRCAACGLHADMCTCAADHPLRQIGLLPGFSEPPFSECDEIAESIWKARSVSYGNGLNVTMPIRTYGDAEAIAKHALAPDESSTVRANVAEALYRLAIVAGTAGKGRPGSYAP